MCIWADHNTSVLKWGSEIKAIPYWSSAQKKMRRYYPDFFIQIKNKDGQLETIIIEIKPHSECLPPKPRKHTKKYLNECLTYQINQDKWSAAKEYAKKHNMKFVVMTEYELGIKKKNANSKTK